MINYGFAHKKGYHTGYRWCARCGTFREGWNKGLRFCEDCHTKLRTKACGGPARAKREAEIVRY